MESSEHGRDRRRAVLYRGELSDPAIVSNALSPFFNYGLGFFETVLYDGGKLHLFDRHLDRMKNTCRDFSVKVDFSEITEEKILRYLESQNLTEHCSRVKILYAPVSDPARWDTVVSAAPYTRPVNDFVLSVHDEVRDTVLNRYKSLNYNFNLHWRDHYRQKDKSDEVLFLNRYGNILEGSYTNILLIKGDTLFYAGKNQNYLKGIMQNRILEAASKSDWRIAGLEKGIDLETLQSADEVMVCNSLLLIKKVGKILRDDEVWKWDTQSGPSRGDKLLELI
ncbi:aminotransferase class IV [Spirochaeta isovalerica]|uniref:branched-chain-amino-acid transaminase n=1 Tax=Spirochaeta isovalerica TaxID=150 RepID=A0A841RBR5_9SPIO|nr:aminotransferase class IV [Spirochaeta isovalerica]MBB6480118.1 4-amino-4-deoxychorismate lyase [Spirochaeta isovalerica]